MMNLYSNWIVAVEETEREASTTTTSPFKQSRAWRQNYKRRPTKVGRSQACRLHIKLAQLSPNYSIRKRASQSRDFLLEPVN